MKLVFSLLFLLCASLSAHTWIFSKSAAVAWSPQSEGGCLFAYEMWRVGSITKDGGNNVSQVDDQCSGHRHGTQSTGARQPLWVSAGGGGGHDVVRFTNQTLVLNNDVNYQGLNTARGHTICVASKFNNVTQSANIYAAIHDTGGSIVPAFQYRNSATKLQFVGDGTTWGAFYWTTTLGTSNTDKVCFTYSGSGATTGGNYLAYVNGTSLGAAISETGGGNNNSVIGNYINGSDVNWDLDGDVTGVWLWDHALDATAITNFVSYVNAEAGV